jgi:hypothetical protein
MDKHLYKMSVNRLPSSSTSNETFNNQATALSWEMWHRHYGHVGYLGLQKLLDSNMVDGFNIDNQINLIVLHAQRPNSILNCS